MVYAHVLALRWHDLIVYVFFFSKIDFGVNVLWYICWDFLESKPVLDLNVQQLMHQEDSSLNGGLFSGTYSLQGQMRSIQRLLQLTLRFLHIFRFSYFLNNKNYCLGFFFSWICFHEIKAQQIKAREQQQLQMQQLQLLQQRNAQLQRRDPNHPALGGSINAINSEGVMGQPSASVLAMKMYEERMKHPHSMDSETSPALIDASRMALLKSAANPQG